MLSVNQINAQIKLTEMWKATNDSEHPFKSKRKVLVKMVDAQDQFQMG